MAIKASFMKIEPDFILSKVAMFSYYGAKYMMTSFFVVFLKSFGINAGQAGLITGIRSTVQALGGMMLGWLADYTKARKNIFMTTTTILILSSLAMPFAGFFITGTSGIRNGLFGSKVSKNMTSKNSTFELPMNNVFYEKNTVLFWVFIVMNLVFGFCDGIHGLVDSVIMNHVKSNGEKRTNYSFQRLWGSLGYGIVPIVCGIFLDTFRNSTFSIYMPVFYIFTFLNILAIIGIMRTLKTRKIKIINYSSTDLEPIRSMKDNSENGSLLPVMCRTACQLDFIVVIWNSFLNGIAGACQWGFIYLYMEDEMKNATKTIMGLSFMASSFIEAFVAPFIGNMVKRLGNSFLPMSVSLLGYGATFLFYYLNDGLIVFFINMIAGLTYPLYLYTAQEEITRLSKKQCLSSLFAFDRGIYSGLGGGIGGVVAGSLYKAYGGRTMYLAIAVFYMISAIQIFLYGLYKLKRNRVPKNEKDLLECVELNSY